MNMKHILKAIEYARDGMFVPKDLTLELIEKSGCKKSASILVMFSYEMLPVLWEAGYTNVSLAFDKPRTSIYNIAKKFGNGKVYELEEIDVMKFDVVVGNPPFGDNENRTLGKEFMFKAISLSKKHVAMILPYGNRTYSSGVAEQYRHAGLYKIEDCTEFFPTIGLPSVGTYYFDRTKVVNVVDDAFEHDMEIPARNCGQNYHIAVGKMARYDFEHLLKDSGKYKFFVTASVQKYSDDIELVAKIDDKTRGSWRVVLNFIYGGHGLGPVSVAGPDDVVCRACNVIVASSKDEAEKVAKYLQTDKVATLAASVKRSNQNSKKWLQYIPMPE
jgi:Eco57I restriction-modification methylase